MILADEFQPMDFIEQLFYIELGYSSEEGNLSQRPPSKWSRAVKDYHVQLL